MLKYYFKKLDMFGHKINLEVDKSSKLNTPEGAFFSFLSLVTIIIISFIFGKELYQRKIPIFSLSKDMSDESLIDLMNFPVIFSLSDLYGKQIPNIHNYISFEIVNFVFDEQEKVTPKIGYSLDSCNNQKEYFKGEASSLALSYIENNPFYHLCFNFKMNSTDYQVKNDFATKNSNTFRLRIQPCYDNPFHLNCLLKEGEKLPFVPVVILSFFDSFLDNSNYEKPLNYYRKSKTYTLAIGSTNYVYLDITEDLLISDNGWLLEDKITTSFYHIESINVNYEGNSRDLLNILFSGLKLRNKTVRSYLKAQELFAKIGGFTNAIFIFMQIILENYVRFTYLAYVHNNSFKQLIYDNPSLKSILIKYSENINTKKNIISTIAKNNFALDKIPHDLSYNVSKNNLVDQKSININKGSPVMINNLVEYPQEKDLKSYLSNYESNKGQKESKSMLVENECFNNKIIEYNENVENNSSNKHLSNFNTFLNHFHNKSVDDFKKNKIQELFENLSLEKKMKK